MSDPVTNVEIEDVLSSIRRLVSTDEREARAEVDQKEPEVDKLVLTPSLRIDNDASEDDLHNDGQPDDDPQNDGADAAEQSPDVTEKTADDSSEVSEKSNELEDGVASDSDAGQEDASQDDDGDVEADDEDLFAFSDSDDDHPEDNDSADQPQEDTSDAENETSELPDGDMAAGDQENPMANKALGARVAELEDVVAARDDQWEPDGESDDDYAGGAVAALPWQDHLPEEEINNPEQMEVAEADVGLVSVPKEDAQDEKAGIASKTATSGEVEKPAAESAAQPFDDVDDRNILAADDRFDESEAILDEEALRDLVSEIVRQELQGALGERITRNVRKLVRREIHRALASQELE